MNRIRIPLAIFSLLLCALPVLAHDMTLFAYVEKGKVHVEGFDCDDKPLAAAAVQLFDSRDKLLATATTGSDGRAVLPVPVVDDLQVRVSAGEHSSTYRLMKDEVSAGR